MQYNIKDDGKLHTRLTDLVRATPKQVVNIINEQLGKKQRFKSDVMTFGEIRHDQWQRESEKTGLLPEVFRLAFPKYKGMQVTFAEKEFASELFKDIVVHSRMDAISVPSQTVVDYKTMVEGAGGARRYKTSKQLIFYALQLAIHNIRITKAIYFIEIWDREHKGIIGYDVFEMDIKPLDLMAVKKWAYGRCEVLAIGMRMAGLWNG